MEKVAIKTAYQATFPHWHGKGKNRWLGEKIVFIAADSLPEAANKFKKAFPRRQLKSVEERDTQVIL